MRPNKDIQLLQLTRHDQTKAVCGRLGLYHHAVPRFPVSKRRATARGAVTNLGRGRSRQQSRYRSERLESRP